MDLKKVFGLWQENPGVVGARSIREITRGLDTFNKSQGPVASNRADFVNALLLGASLVHAIQNDEEFSKSTRAYVDEWFSEGQDRVMPFAEVVARAKKNKGQK